MAKDTSQLQLSVVIPAFNAERFISECLKSVLTQETRFKFEVIVVNDGSEDETPDIIKSQFPSVRLISKPNGGPGSARNVGVKAANSDVIIFIDSDDRMLPGRIERQGGFMLNHPEIAFSVGNCVYQNNPKVNKNGALLRAEVLEEMISG